MLWWTLQQLKSNDAGTRLKAVEKLAAEADPRHVEPLLSVLNDPSLPVRLAVIKIVGELKSEQAVSPLLACLHAREADVREAAAEALKNIGDARAVPPLVSALKDPTSSVRWRAANALDSLGWQPRDETEGAWHIVALGKLEKAAACGPAAVEPLILFLKGGVYYKRMQAIEALSKISDPRVGKALIGTLRDEDGHVRAAAVTALARLGEVRAVEPLIVALRDKEPQVRTNAVEALSKIGDPRGIEPLAALLEDSNRDVRMAAIDAMGRFKDARTTEVLAACLRDKDRETRQAAAQAIGKIGNPAAVELLVITLLDAHEAVRQTAAAMLTRIDPDWAYSEAAQRAVPTLKLSLNASEHWIRQAAKEVLAKLGIQTATSTGLETQLVDPNEVRRQLASRALREMMTDADRDFRQAAAEALGRLGDPQSMEPLAAALEDEDVWVRQAAASALLVLPWQPADEAQRAQQWVILGKWDEAAALGDAAVEPLIESLSAPTSVVRAAAAKALARVGEVRAHAPLAARLTDEYREVRRAAAEALTALGWETDDEVLRAWHGVELGHWDVVVGLGPAAVPALVAALKERSADPAFGAAAEAALARITDPRAVGPLIDYTRDPEVTRSMVAGLEQILAFQTAGIDENHLRTLAGFHTLMESKLDYDQATGVYTPALEEVDCGLIGQLAQQELLRRGVPA